MRGLFVALDDEVVEAVLAAPVDVVVVVVEPVLAAHVDVLLICGTVVVAAAPGGKIEDAQVLSPEQ